MTFALRTGREFVGLVYTGSPERRKFLYPKEQFDTVMRGLNEINFGEIYVNRHHFEAFQGFHAGVRQSGLGGDDGEHGLEEFLETHIAYVDYKLG